MEHPTAGPTTENAELGQGVASAMQVRLDQFEATAGAYGEAASVLASRIGVLARGGKRLRAALAYWAFRAYGGAAGAAEAYELGAAVELFQASALLHDDLIDESVTRRGEPTANQFLLLQHQRAGWRGDPAKYGFAGALLLGDIALSLAYDAANDAARLAVGRGSLDDDGAETFRKTLSQMCQTVFLGQYLDILAENDTSVSAEAAIDRALLIAHAKSASYSAEFPLRLGAILAGASAAQAEELAKLGIPLGIAFQLRDDLLGVFGDSGVTGKPAGDDIRQGKRTLLIEKALGRGSAYDREILLGYLGKPDLTPTELEQARAIIQPAVAEIEGVIASNTEAVLSGLTALDIADAPRSELVQLADRMVNREF